MAGFPLALHLADIERECTRSDDPEGIRARVLLIEERYLKERRKEYADKQKK